MSATNFMIGLAAGAVVGAIGYKYVVVDKKVNVEELSKTVSGLARRVLPKATGQGGGMGRGQGGMGGMGGGRQG
ncbi:MAG: hypothetical protein K6A65_07865 [Succinivibrionaceae bacterium]|nr:hypothetical protein [Succinivibrionaceae bacterium]